MGSEQHMQWFNIFDPLVDPLVLVGSSLSCLMSFLVLLAFAVYRQEQRTFRHALVLNLAIAEFINSLNGTISGSYFVVTKKLTPGALCTINGWVAQVSVQAADFSMLAIAVITLLTITELVYMPAISRAKKILICLSIWIIPLTTGCIAVAMGVMMPAGANWCWISASRTDLRYALNHGWRFVIIAAIICIYGYVYWYMSRHFKSLAATERSSNYNSMAAGRRSRIDSMQKHPYALAVAPRAPDVDDVQPASPDRRNVAGRSWLRLSTCSEHSDFPQLPDSAVTKEDVSLKRSASEGVDGCADEPSVDNVHLARSGSVSSTASTMSNTMGRVETQKSPHTRRVKREVKKMLLLNAYPILYVLLWIPALVNRLLQAANHDLSSRVLDALQTSSAFVGLASGITYGFNQQLRRLIARDLYYWWARRGWSRNKS